VQNIILLILCLGIGVALRASGKLPDNAHAGLNGFIIHVAFPALILRQVHGLHLSAETVSAVLMPWVLFVMGAALFWVLSRVLRLSPGTTGALMLMGGLGNTSFIGLPMIEAFYGNQGIATGILIDTLGTYLVLSTLGIAVACIYSSVTADPREIGMRVLTFPPLIAVAVALLLMNATYPDWLDGVLARLGGTLAPLALVSVGLQIRLRALRGHQAALALGLSYKLIAAPALLSLLYLATLTADGHTKITLFESAMGPQIGASIVAVQYGLNPELVTMMVGFGTLLAFLTVPCWWAMLSAL
jgi:predicted permease